MLRLLEPKPIRWVGSARADLRRFPESARLAIGFQLWRLQLGQLPGDWRPMTSVGPGVREFRIHTVGEHRVVYVTRFPEAIYVLHAFQKWSRRTDSRDLALARQRLERLTQERGSGD